MNEIQYASDLHARLGAARDNVIHPLLMRATDVHGAVHIHHAINEVSLFRQTYQAARLRILIDERERMAELIADGIMGGDAGGLDRLQPFGAWPDPADRREPAGADADQRPSAARR